jgi:hypothetical protein
VAKTRISPETAGLKHDLTGRKFGRLFVLSLARRDSKNHQWVCACTCGNVVSTPRTQNLLNGTTTSCGCKREDYYPHHAVSHGLSKSVIYKRWQAMRNRCNRRTDKSYDRYGGRGIKVCGAWDRSFMNFYKWAMAHGYKSNLTLDRIDNDGDYKPSNCQWITMIDNLRKRPIRRLSACRKGHTYTPENTYGIKRRRCKICQTATRKEFLMRKKARARNRSPRS